MIGQLLVTAIPFKPAWLPEHKGCTSRGHVLRLQAKSSTTSLMVIVSGEMDATCHAKFEKARSSNSNSFGLGLYCPTGSRSLTLQHEDGNVEIRPGWYGVVNPKEMGHKDVSVGYKANIIYLYQGVLREFREALGVSKTAGALDFDRTPRRLTPRLRSFVEKLSGYSKISHPDRQAWLPLSVFGVGAQLFSVLWEEHPSGLGDRWRRSHRMSSSDPRIQRALDYYQKHYWEALDNREVARVSGLSRANFYRVFVRHFGCSPQAYLRKLRVERAEFLLQQRSRPSWEAAARAVGFGSTWTLKRAIRTVRGKAPIF